MLNALTFIIGNWLYQLSAKKTKKKEKLGELDAIQDRFTVALSQHESTQRVEKLAEVKKDLLLKLRAAIAELLVSLQQYADQGTSIRDIVLATRAASISLQCARIAGSPETVSRVARLSESIAFETLAIAKLRREFEKLKDRSREIEMQLEAEVDT